MHFRSDSSTGIQFSAEQKALTFRCFQLTMSVSRGEKGQRGRDELIYCGRRQVHFAPSNTSLGNSNNSFSTTVFPATLKQTPIKLKYQFTSLLKSHDEHKAECQTTFSISNKSVQLKTSSGKSFLLKTKKKNDSFLITTLYYKH